MAAGRMYTVTFKETAWVTTNPIDVFELDAATEKPIEIVGLFIQQSTEIGDVQEELIPFQIIRGHTTSGSGGAAPTPRPVKATEVAAGFTAETLNTTVASAGTAVDIHAGAFNVRVGLELWLPEGLEPDTAAANLLVVRLTNAPADTMDLSGTVYVRELG